MSKQVVTIKKCIHPRYSYRVTYRQGDRYLQKYFTTRSQAKSFADEKKVELLNEGRRHGAFTDDERRAVIRARDCDFDLDTAITFYADHLQQRKRSATVLAAYDEFVEIRRKEGVSAAHLRDFDYKLKPFAEKFKKVFASEVTPKDIDKWLFSKKVTAQTRLNHRRLLSNLFGHCVDRSYCEQNPVLRAAKVKVVAKPPGILTPEQTASLLAHCPEEIIPAVTIGLFAGLRRAEIDRLDWSEVDLKSGFITVTAEKSKTSQRRLVDITDNLRRWLEPLARTSGPVRPNEYVFRKHFKVATTKLDEWPSNAMRHSFASYHLALGQNADKTALQLGHSNTTVLFAHYRELVKPDAAKAYFGLTPKTVRPKNIVSMKEAAA